MNFTATKTLHNVKLVNDKLIFDKDFFYTGRELVTTLFTNIKSKPRMCTVINCTDTLLTIRLSGDSEYTELTVDQYIKRTVFWVLYQKADTKEKILKELDCNSASASARCLLRSEVLCGFAALGEKYEIKSNIMSKFTSYITEKPFIFIDNDNKAYTLNRGNSEDGLNIGVIAMDYSESPDDYEEVGDSYPTVIFDRTRNITSNNFINKFKKLVVFDAKTMTVTEDDLNKCITVCEGYDHTLMKKIPTKEVVAFNHDSSVLACLDVSTLMCYCPHKTLVSKIDYVHTAEYTNVSVTFDDIFNTIN